MSSPDQTSSRTITLGASTASGVFAGITSVAAILIVAPQGGTTSSAQEWNILSRPRTAEYRVNRLAEQVRDNLLSALTDAEEPFVYRTEFGGYQFEWSTDSHEVSAEIKPSGQVHVHATDVAAMAGEDWTFDAAPMTPLKVKRWLTPRLTGE